MFVVSFIEKNQSFMVDDVRHTYSTLQLMDDTGVPLALASRRFFSAGIDKNIVAEQLQRVCAAIYLKEYMSIIVHILCLFIMRVLLVTVGARIEAAAVIQGCEGCFVKFVLAHLCF
jgi:hypothetical protein